MIIPIIYEDESLLIVDKPAGIIVHEGAGHANEDDIPDDQSQLLTDWLKQERPEIVTAFEKEDDLYFRPGIVHRLDKDTSGLLIIAKTPEVKTALQSLFKERRVTKKYVALVLGRPEPEQESIESFICRDPHHRRQMTVSLTEKGKLAKTDYQVIQHWQYRYKNQPISLSLVEVDLHSGRMHQIRVHMKYRGWPIIGDQTYRTKPSRNIAKEFHLDRQFLHAKQLTFVHPINQKKIDVISLLPIELQRVFDLLEENVNV